MNVFIDRAENLNSAHDSYVCVSREELDEELSEAASSGCKETSEFCELG